MISAATTAGCPHSLQNHFLHLRGPFRFRGGNSSLVVSTFQRRRPPFKTGLIMC